MFGAKKYTGPKASVPYQAAAGRAARCRLGGDVIKPGEWVVYSKDYDAEQAHATCAREHGVPIQGEDY